MTYAEKFPLGVQTVVYDSIRFGQRTFQVNTRTSNGWWISKYTKQSDIKKELLEQAKRFEETFQAEVDTRYVTDHLRWTRTRLGVFVVEHSPWKAGTLAPPNHDTNSRLSTSNAASTLTGAYPMQQIPTGQIPKEALEVIKLMYSIVKYTGLCLFIHFAYSTFEFFSHWQADGMDWHTGEHGINGLLAAYLFICCYPAVCVAFRSKL
jgi:hypothetical protein